MTARLHRMAGGLLLRPRLTLGLLFALVTLAVLLTPAAPAQADVKCPPGFSGIMCKVGKHIPGVESVAEGVGGLVGKSAAATKAINDVSDGNFLNTWAKGMAGAVTFLLTFIETTAEKLTEPAFGQDWWISQYAVSFALALIMLAFMLVLISARMSTAGQSVSSIELLRQSGARLIFVVPAIAAGPGVLYSVQQLAGDLTKSFATEATKQGHGVVGDLLTLFQKKAGDWGTFGGVVLTIFMLFLISLAAVVLLAEIAISQWGVMLAGLLVPLALMAGAYPPWGRVLRGLATVILTLMFMPVFTFMFFWAVWSALGSATSGNHAENSGFTLLLFLLVSMAMLDAFPLVAFWMMRLLMPDSKGMDDDVRGIAPQPTMGSVYPDALDKLVERRGGGATGASDGDGDGEADSGAPGGHGPGLEGSSGEDGADGGDGTEGAAAGSEGGAQGMALQKAKDKQDEELSDDHGVAAPVYAGAPGSTGQGEAGHQPEQHDGGGVEERQPQASGHTYAQPHQGGQADGHGSVTASDSYDGEGSRSE